MYREILQQNILPKLFWNSGQKNKQMSNKREVILRKMLFSLKVFSISLKFTAIAQNRLLINHYVTF